MKGYPSVTSDSRFLTVGGRLTDTREGHPPAKRLFLLYLAEFLSACEGGRKCELTTRRAPADNPATSRCSIPYAVTCVTKYFRIRYPILIIPDTAAHD